jgi:hypothetical protein
MLRRMMLARLVRVMRGVQVMTPSYVGMVRGLFVCTRVMMLGRFAMVLRRVLVMLRGLGVMLRSFVRSHSVLQDETVGDSPAHQTGEPANARDISESREFTRLHRVSNHPASDAFI